MLQIWLLPQLEEESGDFILPQDGAPPRWHLAVHGFLNDKLPHWWIGRRAPQDLAFHQWPPRSPDITSEPTTQYGYLTLAHINLEQPRGALAFLPDVLLTGQCTAYHIDMKFERRSKSQNIAATVLKATMVLVIRLSNVKTTDQSQKTVLAYVQVRILRDVSVDSLQNRYTGELCERECSPGYFGLNCAKKCHCEHGTCNPVTGSCECFAGFTGEKCDTECPSDTFGVDCQYKCNCSSRAKCNSEDGSCFCPPGLMGERCDEVCPHGRYGMRCSNPCICQNGATCQPVFGTCTCPPGEDLIASLC
ncbi:Multiple epidermal growth factor-like domains protein 6 [Araneus ventricosus]|uniref:Multiple epidermal growth factor-like domains protein 6 n=1 Tax=Araneus ventricosus TaxID=182803 RepID=A0A4Y2DUS7_ARAVE|nr:Multiple epidermal growth factor-like domains protein 6 [Araneus ventricosus]